MEDPVLLSSGAIMDRGTFKDLKDLVCPFTWKRIDPMAYPCITLKRQITDWHKALFL